MPLALTSRPGVEIVVSMRISGRVLVVVLAGAGLAAGLSTVLAMQYVRSIGEDVVLGRLAVLNGTFWYGWVLLSVPLLILSRRVRIDRRPRVAVPVHILAVLMAAVAHVAMQAGAHVVVRYQSMATDRLAETTDASWATEWASIFARQLTQLIDWELMAGAAIVGIAHAYFYYRESQQRALREAQLETSLVEAKLQALQHQVQPHFLFNTLHAISTLMHRDVDAANRMLVKLSDLLRLTLDSNTRPEIRLSEEIEVLEKYLQIEQVRLGARLKTEFALHPDTLDAMVPTLILQPLVENAVNHGIAPHGAPGRVTVGARRQGDMLVLTIDDTGPGPSEHDIAAMSGGIGVANTRARLEHQFGSAFRFELLRHRKGFTVLVALPWRAEPSEVVPTASVA
jgi:signal transduction histidine kinase